MSNAPKNASEKTFQENFVKRMQKYKWEAPDFLNGNKQTVAVPDLVNPWRSELNRINVDQVEGVALTDNEFSQVMAKVSPIANSFEASKLLAMEGSTGKIDGIYRDAHPDVTRRSEEHTSELQSRFDIVCRLLLEKKKKNIRQQILK